MILFFPQWQGAGRGEKNRIDRPARVLYEAMLDPLYTAAEANRGRSAAIDVVEVPLVEGDALETERGIIGRAPILAQLTAARDLLNEHAPHKVFTIGGDCGIEVAPIAYLSAKYDNFVVLWIDGHPDLNTPETSPSGTFHGMPLRILLGEGDADFTELVPTPLTGDNLLLACVRNIDPGEQECIDRHHIGCVPKESRFPGIDTVNQLLGYSRPELGTPHLYIHVDLDALDPTLWPYMHYPEPGGLSVAALTNLVGTVAESFPVVGMSITEYDSIEGDGLDTLAPLLRVFAELSAR